MLVGVVAGTFQLYINHSRIFRVLFLFRGIVRYAFAIRAGGKAACRPRRADKSVSVGMYGTNRVADF